MSTLHTVNKSPFEHQTLASCTRVCLDGDCLLLLEDGVYAALATAPVAGDLDALSQRGVSIFVLEDDARARGLQDQLLASVKLTDYQGFVRLSLEHHTMQSWY